MAGDITVQTRPRKEGEETQDETTRGSWLYVDTRPTIRSESADCET